MPQPCSHLYGVTDEPFVLRQMGGKTNEGSMLEAKWIITHLMILNIGHIGTWLWSTASSSRIQTVLMATDSGSLCALHRHSNYNLQLAPCKLLRGKRSNLFYTTRVDLFRNGWLMDIREVWMLLLRVLQMDIECTKSANTVALSPFPSWRTTHLNARAFAVCLIPNHILHHCFSMLIPVDLVSW